MPQRGPSCTIARAPPCSRYPLCERPAPCFSRTPALVRDDVEVRAVEVEAARRRMILHDLDHLQRAVIAGLVGELHVLTQAAGFAGDVGGHVQAVGEHVAVRFGLHGGLIVMAVFGVGQRWVGEVVVGGAGSGGLGNRDAEVAGVVDGLLPLHGDGLAGVVGVDGAAHRDRLHVVADEGARIAGAARAALLRAALRVLVQPRHRFEQLEVRVRVRRV